LNYVIISLNDKKVNENIIENDISEYVPILINFSEFDYSLLKYFNKQGSLKKSIYKNSSYQDFFNFFSQKFLELVNLHFNKSFTIDLSELSFFFNSNKWKDFQNKQIKINYKEFLVLDKDQLMDRISSFFSINLDYLSFLFYSNNRFAFRKFIFELFSYYCIFEKRKNFLDFENKVIRPTFKQEAFRVFDKDFLYVLESKKFLDNLDFYTFDNEGTIEYDDAIAVRNLRDGYEVFVAIVDLSELWNIHMDVVADFPQTLYTLTKRYTMLDSFFIQKSSFIKSNKRPAIVFRLLFNKDFVIKNTEIDFVSIKIKDNLIYNKSSSFLKESSFLIPISDKLFADRIENGAVCFDIFNKDMKFVIRELMIFVNKTSGDILSKNGFPYLSRTMKLSKKAKDILYSQMCIYNELKSGSNFWVTKFKLLKFLGNAKYSVNDEGHDLLGVKKYCTITNPLRRYFDIINQRQLYSLFFYNDVFYTKKELENIINVISPYFSYYNKLVRMYNKKQKVLSYVNFLINEFKKNEVEVLYFVFQEDLYIVIDSLEEEFNIGSINYLNNCYIKDEYKMVLDKYFLIEVLLKSLNFE